MIKSILNTFASKGLIAIFNLLILLISSKFLGGEVIGQISLLILNISIIHVISEIYSGYALVHYIPKIALSKIYKIGTVWVFACVLLLNFIFWLFNVGNNIFIIHSLALSMFLVLHSFNCVIILAKQKIKIYNLLLLIQPLILLLFLAYIVFFIDSRVVYSYIWSLYPAYIIPMLISSLVVYRLIKKDQTASSDIAVLTIFKSGFMNQLGNLAHMLSNRYSYYVLSSNIIVGLYANATSLIESVWIIGNSITPIVLSRIANSKSPNSHKETVLAFSKVSFLLSLICVIVLYFLPNELFVFILGKDFVTIKQIMLYLAPGMLCISFSVVISHYFSAIGIQKAQLIANIMGLIVTVTTSHYFISRYQIVGACIVASLAYAVQCIVIVFLFIKNNKMKLSNLFTFKKDITLLQKEIL